MAKEYTLVPASFMMPFVDLQQIDAACKYPYFFHQLYTEG